ncbi:hypothetical protein Pcinc_030851 [Petrolisthes cinctipes]|uniref:Uncharacterized protein n=1 Tax=Petrolisthes cinctipes TaxID=88211 RepID=A0AAE1K5F4_PETCI|nr:hypothetical protein Pcinc_030851 [Petrolisthes cinctipes]
MPILASQSSYILTPFPIITFLSQLLTSPTPSSPNHYPYRLPHPKVIPILQSPPTSTPTIPPSSPSPNHYPHLLPLSHPPITSHIDSHYPSLNPIPQSPSTLTPTIPPSPPSSLLSPKHHPHRLPLSLPHPIPLSPSTLTPTVPPIPQTPSTPTPTIPSPNHLPPSLPYHHPHNQQPHIITSHQIKSAEQTHLIPGINPISHSGAIPLPSPPT